MWEGEADEDTEFVMAMEGFDLRMLSMDPALLAPVRVASIFMDRMAEANSLVPVYFASASEAMNTCTDVRLKRWGVYDRSSGVHARDADRHAVYFLRKFADSQELRKRIFGTDPLG